MKIFAFLGIAGLASMMANVAVAATPASAALSALATSTPQAVTGVAPAATTPVDRVGKGMSRDIVFATWIIVAKSISNENTTFYPNSKDSTCQILPGGSIRVIGSDERFGVLVRYTIPPAHDPVGGTSCPTGTQFFMLAHAVMGLPLVGSVARKKMENAAAEAAAVRRLDAAKSCWLVGYKFWASNKDHDPSGFGSFQMVSRGGRPSMAVLLKEVTIAAKGPFPRPATAIPYTLSKITCDK